MSRYWNSTVKCIEPYAPGEQPKECGFIKLNTNENPYPPSPRVTEAIKAAAAQTLRLYPDPSCDALKSAVGAYYKQPMERVFIGNGSDEILAFAFMAFFEQGRKILFPDITYSFYKVYCALLHIDYELVPLDDDFGVPVEGFLKKNGGVVIPNPNAPTAKCMPLESVRKILDCNSDSVVVIDEAYIDFGGESAAGLVNDYPNLLVVMTLSKSRSLAGLRVGFALGSGELIEGLERVKNSFNSYTIDRLALAGAVEAIRDEDHFNETRRKIIETREKTVARVREIGFYATDSKANFIFISHPKVHASELFRRLREKKILVRYFDRPRLDNYLRVTIGTDGEMEEFIKAVKRIIEG